MQNDRGIHELMAQMPLNKSRYLFLPIRAVLFAALLSFPQFVSYFQTGGYCLNCFQDGDEAFYLRAADDIAGGRAYSALYAEHAEEVGLPAAIPPGRPDQSIVPYAVGSAGRILGVRPVTMGVLLDALFPALAYLAFSAFFGLFTRSRFASELSAVFLLVFPWTLSLNNYIHIDVSSLFPAAAPSFISHSTLPVLEGISSQVSYPLFGLCLLLLARSLQAPALATRKLLLLGAAAGMTLYCYIFAWLSITCITGFALFFGYYAVQPPRRSIGPALIRPAASFLLSLLIVSLPGLLLLTGLGREGAKLQPVPGMQIFRTMWYFSLEWFVVLLLGITFLRRISQPQYRTLLLLAVSAIASEFVLLNLQPLLAEALTPLFFSVMYLHPVFSGCIFSLLFTRLYSRRNLRAPCTAIGIVLLLSLPVRTTRLAADQRADDTEFSELAEYLDCRVQERSVLAMLTSERAFTKGSAEWDTRWEPNALAAVTRHHLLQDLWGLEWAANAEEALNRERAIGLLFSGRPRLVRACRTEIDSSHADMFFQQWIVLQLVRKERCRLHEEPRMQHNACEIVRKFRIDYIIWEPRLIPEKPFWLSKVGRLIWRSTLGRYELIKFDGEAAKEYFCEDSPFPHASVR